MSDIIDLDAIDPQPITIKLDGAEYIIQPPTTLDILRLGYYTQKLTTTDLSDESATQQAINDLTAQVYKCVPGISGKLLSKPQLQTLVQIISDMSTPEEKKELDSKGITPNTSEKKSTND